MKQKVSVSLREELIYVDYSTGINNRKEMSSFHMHQDYEILYLLEGERTFFINGNQYKLQAQEMMFIDKNVLHKTSLEQNFDYKRIVVNFRDHFLTDDVLPLIQELFEKSPFVLSIPSQKQPLFEELTLLLLQEYQSKEKGRMLYLRSLLTQIFIESNRLLSVSIPKVIGKETKGRQEIEKLISFINEHYQSNLSLSMLSQYFYLSESYISRLFKELTGCSVSAYVNAVRINEVKRLLLETNLQVKQIAGKVGYTNHVHLWRVFKAQTGFSPNEYRQLYQGVSDQTLVKM